MEKISKFTSTGIKKLVLLILSLITVKVNCIPAILLTHSGTKCFTVDALPRTNLNIVYNAPDMILIDEEKNKEENKEEDNQEPPVEEDALDRISRSRRQAEMKDMSVVISGRAASKTAFLSQESDYTDPRVAARETPRQLRSNLLTRNGTLEFFTGDQGGPIDICIRSLYASRNSPSRFYMLIQDEYVKESDTTEEEYRKQRELIEMLKVEEQQFEEKFSKLNDEMSKIENLILKFKQEADAQLKPQEQAFFDQTIRFQKAVRFWPIIHIVIVLIGGIIQARQIVQFFQSRHIY